LDDINKDFYCMVVIGKEFAIAIQIEDGERFILKRCHLWMSLWDVLERTESE